MIRSLMFLAAVWLAAATSAEAACRLPANAGAMTAEVARLMNAQRARAGLSALAPSEGLARAATRQACDMASNGVRSHTGSDGSSFARRYRAEGCRGAGGENIAWGQPTPARVVDGWMNSSGHRANILHRRARAYGIAVAVKDGKPSWVMVVGGTC